MKLTNEQVNYLKSNQYFTNEGIIKKIFSKLLVKKLKKDADFQSAVDSADSAMSRLQQKIKKAEDDGVSIPDELKKLAGMK